MGRLRRHTNWWVNLILLVVIAVGVAGAVVLMRGKASASTSTRTVTVALGNVSSTVSASGTVAPATSMDLNFLTSGVVSEVDVKAGDKVTAGQVVGRLDPTDADAKVASAQAALVTAQDNLAPPRRPTATTSPLGTRPRAPNSWLPTGRSRRPRRAWPAPRPR